VRKIDFAEAARDCLAETARLIRVHGPRLTGSGSCNAAGREIARELGSFSDSVRVESFHVHPSSFYSYTKLLPVAYLAGFLALIVVHGLFLVPIIGLLAGILLMAGQFGFYWHLGDFFFPRKTGANIEAVIEPTGVAERELIVSGHHDSAPVARIFSGPLHRMYAVAIFLPYVFFLFELVLLLFLLLTGNATAPSWALPVLCVGFVPVAGYFLLVALRQGSPGAGDNLVASLLAVRIAREIASRRADLLKSTRLRVVSFDSEEAGLRGASAYMRAHAKDLGRLPCFHLNFDSIYQLGHLQVLTTDINGTVRLSGEMVEMLQECARENGHFLGTFGMLFGAGGTDAAESARKGLHATTVIAMPTAIVRDGLVYHTPRDTVDHIEPAAVEACMKLAVSYLRRLEDSGRAAGRDS
jgi:aminopeptidase YwaD